MMRRRNGEAGAPVEAARERHDVPALEPAGAGASPGELERRLDPLRAGVAEERAIVAGRGA